MPQWRKLYVKATESLDINDMPDDFHRLLWVMLPLGLDSEGRGIDNSAWVKSKIMPLRTDVSYEMIAAAMQWFADHSMIERYQAGGRKYFWIPTFHNYQGKTDREAESTLPPPPPQYQQQGEGYSRASHELVLQNSCLDVDSDSDIDSYYCGEPPKITQAEAEQIADELFPPPIGGENQESEKRLTPEEYKDRITAAIARGAARDEQLRGALFVEFHRNYDYGNRYGKEFMGWLKDRPPGETVERFAAWWWEDYWLGRDKKQTPTLKQIHELWPQAFQPKKPLEVSGSSPGGIIKIIPGHERPNR